MAGNGHDESTRAQRGNRHRVEVRAGSDRFVRLCPGGGDAGQAAGTTVAKDMGQWPDAFNTFSVGIGAGGSFLHVPASLSTTDGYAPNSYSGTLSRTLNPSNFTASAEAGKDWRFNNFVVGVYGDITAGDQKTSVTRSYDAPSACRRRAPTPST